MVVIFADLFGRIFVTLFFIKNIPRIGKLPSGAKRSINERKALLKERLY